MDVPSNLKSLSGTRNSATSVIKTNSFLMKWQYIECIPFRNGRQRVKAIEKQQNSEQYRFLFPVLKIIVQALSENKPFDEIRSLK